MKKFISFLLRNVPRKYLQLFSHWALKIVAAFYKGDKRTCPICENSYRKFLPYGRLEPRPDVLCPSCLSLERHRLMWLYLKNETDFFDSPYRLLHIAPEISFLKRFQNMENLEYVTADLESPLAEIKMDIHEMPFDENSFDVVFCNHVMEHVEDDLLAMQEIHRVLRPGGWSIIQIPFFSPVPETTYEDHSITSKAEREKIFGQDDHVRKYGLDYSNRLRSAGFEVEVISYPKSFSEEDRKRLSLDVTEDIYLCKKNLAPFTS